MFGTVCDEREVNVPAIEAWKVYGTLKIVEIAQSLPNVFSKVNILQGDGGVGTIFQVFYPPGTSHGMTSFKEKYTVVDDSKMVKEFEIIEGGYLDLGFTLFRVRSQMIEKEDKNWCITKTTIEYEVKEEAAANASMVSIQPYATVMEFVADYLVKNYNKNTSPN